MTSRGRIALALLALVVVGLTGWAVLLQWVSSQGLFENSEPASGGQVAGALAAFALAVAGLLCAVNGRPRAAAALLVVPTAVAAVFVLAIT